MKQYLKCEYCTKPLTVDDCVMIRISRYDTFGKRIKKRAYCTNCWDHTKIFVQGLSMDKYYDMNQLHTDECIVKVKDNPHKCGNCKYLIFKDHRHNEGLCRITRLQRRCSDICVHEEEMS